MRKSPKGCRAGGRTGRKCLSVVRQENEREDQRDRWGVCGVCAKEDKTRFDGTRSFDMYSERSLSLS